MFKGKTAIAMSGGVDSSVAAWLVQQAGYETAGITLKLYDNEDIGICDNKTCCSQNDVEDAAMAADKMGMNHYVLNYRQEFIDHVIKRFIDSYNRGQTPNPCIDCNKYIKFGKLCHAVKAMGFTHIATGHYARIECDDVSKRWLLKKSINEDKDQSYVLFNLTQEQLSMLLLPLGDLSKPQVRQIAQEQHFMNAAKHDSQDICFVPNGNYSGFIENFTGMRSPEGDFLDSKGNILGRHKGLIRYTIGQRKGLGLIMNEPVFVKAKDAVHNRVIVAADNELYTKSLDAVDVNLIACDHFEGTKRLKARIRYKHPEQWAHVTMTGSDRFHVEFDEPQRAIAPGQAVVLYDGDIVFGGGIIS